MLESCTCGEAHPHEVMRRSTADGIDVCLWSDGMITGAMGYRIRGVPAGRPRSAESRRLALRAGRLLLGEVCLYDREELGDLYAAARKAAARDGLPGTLRAELRRREERPAQIPITWTVLAADRDGVARERFGRLPRLRWPGRAVFDFCNGPGSAGGRYVLASRMTTGRRAADETWDTSTGMRFSRLDDLFAFLLTE